MINCTSSIEFTSEKRVVLCLFLDEYLMYFKNKEMMLKPCRQGASICAYFRLNSLIIENCCMKSFFIKNGGFHL